MLFPNYNSLKLSQSVPHPIASNQKYGNSHLSLRKQFTLLQLRHLGRLAGLEVALGLSHIVDIQLFHALLLQLAHKLGILTLLLEMS